MIRALVVRVGREPVVEQLRATPHGSYIDELQRVCGGNVQIVTMDDGVDLWCNEDGIALGLPINRVIEAAPRAELGGIFEGAEVIYVEDADEPLARPGEAGVWKIYGDFLMLRTDKYGECCSVTDADVERWTKRFVDEDIEHAKRMNAAPRTVKPVTVGGWYEHTDGTWGRYEWGGDPHRVMLHEIKDQQPID